MAEITILDKSSTVEGGKVIRTKVTEEHLSLQDLYQAKQNLNHQKQGLMQQMTQMKERLLVIEEQDKENDEFIQILEKQFKEDA
ncbi:MAG: hypothetical protein ACQEW2_02415 [Bacillota bacterium]|uniref:hypothetical protein n=1 Tax=Cytobacillus firmus TaxID=1399 RepID=UPI0018CDB133|nr:hypothetical protein [Cytobacillus firmus]MBG9603965.1 hypothetical protein [Cytobacillus firmus]MBG9656055.1 hypothetical protein [Cytobacillus firmus]MED1907878.1 hypothetical protein [Cytobacillus firmus]